MQNLITMHQQLLHTGVSFGCCSFKGDADKANTKIMWSE